MAVEIDRIVRALITLADRSGVTVSPGETNLLTQIRPVAGILQARTLEWVVISFSNA